VPAHYGNPLAEQKRLDQGSAVVLLSRGVLTVSGTDRLSWLDSLTSQRLTTLQAGDSTETLLLDPHGHIEHSLRVVDDGETAWIVTESSSAEPLTAFLNRMRFMLRVEVADRSAFYAVIGSVGDSLVPDAVAVWRDSWSEVAAGGVSYASERGHPGAQWAWSESILPVATLPELADRVRAGQLAVAGTIASEALRIAVWRPRHGIDTDERSIPHELDWLRSAVHLAKGCYRGQETVAKVHNLGHPPRRLVLLDLDGSDGVLPPSGSVVYAERRGEQTEVGRVTSSANHFERGPIALAVIKRTVPADAPLTVRSEQLDIAAAQEVIVPVDAGRTVGTIPRLPRVGSIRS